MITKYWLVSNGPTAVRSTMCRAIHDASPPGTAIIPRDRVLISGASGAIAGGFLGIILRMNTRPFESGTPAVSR